MIEGEGDDAVLTKKYKNQVSILENAGIDSGYLESAMQVYLVNYTDSSLALYVGRSGLLRKLINSLKGGDEYDAIVSPYILIKPSSFDDNERLEQLYNHELFHHYQYEILCGHSECEPGEDPYIIEATANWASSLVTKKTDNNGYATLKLSLKAGKYTITATYKNVKVSNKITVKPTLITKNKKIKKGKTLTYTAKLLNKNGKKLKNKKITFKINGKKYKAKTNKKGIAKIKVKNLKKGKYKIKTAYGKQKNTNTITVK